TGDVDDGLRVIEISGWKIIYFAKLRQRPLYGSFFEDSKRFYVETLAYRDGKQLMSDQAVLDLETRGQTGSQRVESPDGVHIYYRALKDRLLLGAEYNGTKRRTDSLVRATLPSYKEIQRVSFTVAGGIDSD